MSPAPESLNNARLFAKNWRPLFRVPIQFAASASAASMIAFAAG